MLIFKKLLNGNQLVFKANFTILHRIVDSIYRNNEQTSPKFHEILNTYWEIASKFLLLWGVSSGYMETNSISSHYDVLLAKVIQFLPKLSKIQYH